MKIICIGRNYANHARELSNAVPTEPVIFLKPQSALLADGKMEYPDFTKDLHYECELVVRIGTAGKKIAETDALKHIDAITLGIDFTARDLQEKQKEKKLPWEIAKAFDGSAAVGSFISLPQESLQELEFRFLRNDEEVQHGETRDMIFSVQEIIAYASRFFSLEPGDLIFTGTPEGVGPVQPGDSLRGDLEGQEVLHLSIV